MRCSRHRTFQTSQKLSGSSVEKEARTTADQPLSNVSSKDAPCQYFNVSSSRCLNNDIVRGMLKPSSSSPANPSINSFGPARSSSSFCSRKHNETFGRTFSSIVLRQLKDDDSLAGDFNRHQFLDDASRQQWNPQHGISGVFRYCWVDGPGWSPSTGPVSSSWCDLAAHLATVDRLHDQYLATFRRGTSHKDRFVGEGIANHEMSRQTSEEKKEPISTHDGTVTSTTNDHDSAFDGTAEPIHSCCCDLHYIQRVRLAYNWFVSTSSPREKRAQERRQKLAAKAKIGGNIDKPDRQEKPCETADDGCHAQSDPQLPSSLSSC